MSNPYQHKVNRIKAYTLQYLKAHYPQVLEEAQAQARLKWNEENPDNPWTGIPGRVPQQWKDTPS